MRHTMLKFMVTASVFIVTLLTDVTPQTVTSHTVTPKTVTLHAKTQRIVTPHFVTPHDNTPQDVTPQTMTSQDMTLYDDVTSQAVTTQHMTSKGVTTHALTPQIARALTRSSSAAKPSARFSENSDFIPKRMRRPVLKRVGKFLRSRKAWLKLITAVSVVSGVTCLIIRNLCYDCTAEHSRDWLIGSVVSFSTGGCSLLALCAPYAQEELQSRRDNAVRNAADTYIEMDNVDQPHYPHYPHHESPIDETLRSENLDASGQTPRKSVRNTDVNNAFRNAVRNHQAGEYAILDARNKPERPPRRNLVTSKADVNDDSFRHSVSYQQADQHSILGEPELQPTYDDASAYHTGEEDNLDD